MGDDEGVQLPIRQERDIEKYDYGAVINTNNPLLSNKGTPTVIEKHRRELRELFETLQRAREDRQVEKVDSTKLYDQQLKEGEDHFKFTMNEFDMMFASVAVDNEQKRLLRKATLMPQYKEVNLEFVSDNLQEIKQRSRKIRKHTTFQLRESDLKPCNNLIKQSDFEVIQEDNIGEGGTPKQVSNPVIPEQHNDFPSIHRGQSDNLVLMKAIKAINKPSPAQSDEDKSRDTQDSQDQKGPGQFLSPITYKKSTFKPGSRRRSVKPKPSKTQQVDYLSPDNEVNSKTDLKLKKRRSGSSRRSKSKKPKVSNTQLIQQSDLNTLKLQLKLCPKSSNQIDDQADLQVPDANDLRLCKIQSENVVKNYTTTLLTGNPIHRDYEKPSVFDKVKQMPPYNEILLSDLKFKDFYSDALYQAIFTFPKFQRTYSKNYKSVQMSFRKVSKKKKTIVFDIDETLVLATTNKSELKDVDDQIFIKMTRFGGSARAYLSFRPYLHEMLDELSKDFELILYTCGTASYAQCFADAVQKKRKYFNHILCLSHCLYSIENDMFIKDLKILEEGRSLSDIVIVDNNIQSFFLQLSNGIPIYDYTGDKNDEVLLSLTHYLKTFLDVPDVRQKIDRDFKIKELLEEKADMYMGN